MKGHTHAESKAIRSEIAAAVKSGVHPEHVMVKFGVNKRYIQSVCFHAGIPCEFVGQRGPHPRWDGVDWTRRDKDIARDMRVSHQRVQQVRDKRGAERSTFHRQNDIGIQFDAWLEKHVAEVPSMTLREIGEASGAHYGTVAHWLARRGISAKPHQFLSELTIEQLRAGCLVEDGCWIWCGRISNQGRAKVGEHYGNRYVWRLVHGSIPPGLCVLMKCGRRECLNPSHMELAEARHAHRYRVVNWNALSDEDVAEIRRRRLAGEKLADLADAFDVSYQHVSDIVCGRSRKCTG